MNPLRKKYLYIKQVNGKGRFGGVELQMIWVNNESKVIDKCEWKDWKKNNKVFQETSYMKSIKTYILDSIEYIVQNFIIKLNFEISLIDIKILPVDTLPSHILASAVVGVFDVLGETLSKIDIKKIDKFITENEDIEFPKYEKLISEILNGNG